MLARPICRDNSRRSSVATRIANDCSRCLARMRSSPSTGPGGVGKTRLAVDAVATRLSEFAQGAWLIELAPISDPRLVAGAVASTLEIPLSPDQPPQKALAARLRTQELLLLIDNCEHVVEAAARVIESIFSRTRRRFGCLRPRRSRSGSPAST